jgi:uncharacterized membrane protein
MSEVKYRRIILLDILRGVAIIGVIFYHFAFDLGLLEFIQTDVTYHPVWVAFARVLSGSFLLLAGISLVLAHGKIIRWRAFFKRFIIVGGAALATSIVTFFAYPDMYIYFGILHALALFSLLALPFLRMPLWFVGIVSLFVFCFPFFFSNPIFNEKIFSWIGLWSTPPITGDLVPIFPSFALTLFGVFFARLAINFNFIKWLSDVSFKGIWARFLAKAGRWSLIIYLVHQPILLAVLYPIAAMVKPEELSKEQEFYGACFGSCIETSGGATHCKSYCQCSLEQVSEGDYWEVVNLKLLTKEQGEIVKSISNLCAAMSVD